MRIAFLGGGNMAARADRRPDRQGHRRALDRGGRGEPGGARAPRRALSGAHRDRARRGDAALPTSLVLAVKPQDAKSRARFDLACSSSSSSASPPALRCDTLSRWLGGHRKLVRCMPNTPALIGAGIAGLYALPEVSAEEKKQGRDHPRRGGRGGLGRRGAAARSGDRGLGERPGLRVLVHRAARRRRREAGLPADDVAQARAADRPRRGEARGVERRAAGDAAQERDLQGRHHRSGAQGVRARRSSPSASGARSRRRAGAPRELGDELGKEHGKD